MLTYEHILEGSWTSREVVDGWEFVEMFYGDEWRWGMWEHYVYRRVEDDKLFQFNLQRSHGEDREDWWSVSDICDDFDEVQAVEVTKVEYQVVK